MMIKPIYIIIILMLLYVYLFSKVFDIIRCRHRSQTTVVRMYFVLYLYDDVFPKKKLNIKIIKIKDKELLLLLLCGVFMPYWGEEEGFKRSIFLLLIVIGYITLKFKSLLVQTIQMWRDYQELKSIIALNMNTQCDIFLCFVCLYASACMLSPCMLSAWQTRPRA